MKIQGKIGAIFQDQMPEIWLSIKKMHLGLSTYTFPWNIQLSGRLGSRRFSFREMLEFTAENSIHYFQFGDNYPLHLLTNKELDELKKTASAKNISLQAGTRGLYMDNISRYLLIAKKLETGFLRVVTDDSDFYPTEDEVILTIRQLLPILKETGIVLAIDMLDICKTNHVSLFIHENFRWQLPVRKLKETLDSGVIGRPFKARVSFCSAFPVFDNQPFLKTLDHFILTDIGSHVLDICRFLFGEAKKLCCLTQRVNAGIKGEDVANVLMEMQSGLHCYAEMSYASIMEKEAFPQTLIFIEGEGGSLHLTNDFELKIIKKEDTTSTIIQPVMYSWLNPAYAVVHSSIVDCNRNILQGLQGGDTETTGQDNFKTVQLVWASYESAATGKAIHF